MMSIAARNLVEAAVAYVKDRRDYFSDELLVNEEQAKHG